MLTNQTNELTIQIDFIYKQINNILARLVEFNELITANRTSIQQMQTRSSEADKYGVRKLLRKPKAAAK